MKLLLLIRSFICIHLFLSALHYGQRKVLTIQLYAMIQDKREHVYNIKFENNPKYIFKLSYKIHHNTLTT